MFIPQIQRNSNYIFAGVRISNVYRCPHFVTILTGGRHLFLWNIWYKYCSIVGVLDERDKKQYLRIRGFVMKNKSLIGALALIPLVLVLTQCSSSLPADQMRFGVEAAKLDLWDEAIFRWKKVLQNDPNSASAHNNLAVAYEKKSLWEEAKTEYGLALKIRPDDKHINSNYQQFIKRYEARKDEIPKKQ
jgi:tetratricopeptide (TPR) repeat protein